MAVMPTDSASRFSSTSERGGSYPLEHMDDWRSMLPATAVQIRGSRQR